MKGELSRFHSRLTNRVHTRGFMVNCNYNSDLHVYPQNILIPTTTTIKEIMNP